MTAEQVNEVARILFIENQRRVNLKLCSQNHRAKTGEADEDDEECLGKPEIKIENEKAVEENKNYYAEIVGIKQEKIETIAEF